MGDAGFISSAVLPGHAPRRIEHVFAGTQELERLRDDALGPDPEDRHGQVMTMMDLARNPQKSRARDRFPKKDQKTKSLITLSKRLEAGLGV